MFDPKTCALLERLITGPPQTNHEWYRVWCLILDQLFPLSRGYALAPLHRVTKDNRHTPCVAYNVSKFIDLTATPHSVLIVVIMESPDWQACVPSLEKEINRLTDATLSGTLMERAVPTSKIFWIGTIGHHWRYGIKEDNGGREMKPLIDWHETIHDEASYDDFQRLVALIADLV